tara:strand:+ start:80 stop:478 length:399 start_codon:yes stop_codon:yes gene_type:complete
MHLDDLLSNEIQIDFDNNLGIKPGVIKSIIHKWPDQIYDIIIMMQKDKKLSHYVFQLPDASGVLELNLNRKTKKLNVVFYDKNTLSNQRKFKTLLGEVYADILEDQALENANYSSFTNTKPTHFDDYYEYDN